MATKRKSGSGISDEMLDQLLGGDEPQTAADFESVIGTLKKALAERMLNAEMDVHIIDTSFLR